MALNRAHVEEALGDAMPQLVEALDGHLAGHDTARIELKLKGEGRAHDLGEDGGGEDDIRAPPYTCKTRVPRRRCIVGRLQLCAPCGSGAGNVTRDGIGKSEGRECSGSIVCNIARASRAQPQAP